MKKLYFLICSMCFASAVDAQVTIFNPNFSDGTYTGVPAVEADLVAHADWNAGHFNNANTWVAFQTGSSVDVLRTGAFFTWMLADNQPIIATDGDIVTIRTVVDYGFTGQSYGSESDENMVFIGLLNQNNPLSGADGNNPNRDGVMVVNKAQTGQIALTNNNGVGSAFDPTTAILATESTHLYEVIIEYSIADTAANSSKIVRITSVGGANGSSTSTVSNALSQNVYDALTTTGAYFFNWALRFGFGTSDLSHLHMRQLSLAKNIPLILSIEDKQSFEFSAYPNPVKNLLQINTRETITSAAFFDMLGKRVLSVTDVGQSIDVSTLHQGMYIVKLTSAKGTSTKKVLKE